MTITAFRIPTALASIHFVGAAKIIDPHDGSEQLAATDYHVDLPSLPTRSVGGKTALAETFRIKITPRAKIKLGTVLTTELRDHEQFHFDVGFVIARRVAVVLSALRADSTAELDAKFKDVMHLHFKTRNKLIHRRYDLDTRHGTQAHYQKVWTDRMRACLLDASAKEIGGFYL